MSLQEQQTFLARLFTEEKLRFEFLENPLVIGKANGLSDYDISQISAISTKQLSFFADSLFHKRLHEVGKLLPFTKVTMGDNFSKLFYEFSQSFSPVTIKKHLEDAIEFVKFINKQKTEMAWIKDLARYESLRISFNNNRKRLLFSTFEHDIKKIFQVLSDSRPDLKSEVLPKKRTFAVWLRVGKKSKHFIF